jgi:hypothetical protein
MIYSQILLFLLSFQPNPAFAQEMIDKGYRLPNDSVSKDFTLMALALEEDFLTKYIIKTNYQVDKNEAALIAQNILKVSKCFNLDPWVLTGLVQKESSFKKDAVSATDATGLTQFTSSGFQEVNDQLGFHGKSGATDVATLYYSTRLKECIDPNWVDLWLRVGVPEQDPNFYSLLKAEVKADIPTALTYGAILLKTYVSFIDSRALKSDTPLSISETYFQALQIYNGEEGDAKVKYAKGVFNNLKTLYPKEVNFPFLQDQ